MCVVILRPSAMKYVVFGDSYVSRLGRLDLSLCLPGEVRFFGRGVCGSFMNLMMNGDR